MISENSGQMADRARGKRPRGSFLRPSSLVLGAAILFAGGHAAGAVDWYTGDKTSEPDYAPSVVLDSSDSLTSKQSNFGAVALTTAVEGNLAQEGFRARVEGIAGSYNYFLPIRLSPTHTMDGWLRALSDSIMSADDSGCAFL